MITINLKKSHQHVYSGPHVHSSHKNTLMTTMLSVYKTNHFDNLLHPVPTLSIHPMKKNATKWWEGWFSLTFCHLFWYEELAVCWEFRYFTLVLVRSNNITFSFVLQSSQLYHIFSKLLQVWFPIISLWHDLSYYGGLFPCKLRSETNQTKVSPKILLMKSSGNNFIFSSVFYLIICVMKS